MKCRCGGYGSYHKSYGDNYYEPREDIYICDKCGKYLSSLED